MSFRSPSTEHELDIVDKKKWKNNSGKKRDVAETNDDEGTQEDDTSAIDVKPAPKGSTTAYFIKFVVTFTYILSHISYLSEAPRATIRL